MAENMPKSPPPPPRFLSEVPSRSYQSGGTYKHHGNLGHAKNAIRASGSLWDKETHRYAGLNGGKIWEWDFDTNTWGLLYDVPPGTRESELPWL